MDLNEEIRHWEEVGYPNYDGMPIHEYIAGKIYDYGVAENLGYSDTLQGFECLMVDIAREMHI